MHTSSHKCTSFTSLPFNSRFSFQFSLNGLFTFTYIFKKKKKTFQSSLQICFPTWKSVLSLCQTYVIQTEGEIFGAHPLRPTVADGEQMEGCQHHGQRSLPSRGRCCSHFQSNFSCFTPSFQKEGCLRFWDRSRMSDLIVNIFFIYQEKDSHIKCPVIYSLISVLM